MDDSKFHPVDGSSGPGSISRRGFLKGVGAGAAIVAGTGSAAPALPGAQETPVKVLGPGDVEITLRINGENRKLKVEPRVTLLDAMRNRLDLTGAKKVCDRATCGACSVLVGGKAIYSCTMLAVEAVGLEIQTVESLGNPDALSEVQQAIWDNDGQQCGFCTPGFVVACTSVLRQEPGLSMDEVPDRLGGNLCRCGTYAGLKAALASCSRSGAVKSREGGE